MLDRVIDKGSDLYWTNTKDFGSLFHYDNNGDVYKQIRSCYLHPLFLTHRTHWYFGKRKPEEHFLWDI